MTDALIAFSGFFGHLSNAAMALMMLLMALDGQRPYGAPRAVWNVAWTLMGLAATCTFGLFIVWLSEHFR